MEGRVIVNSTETRSVFLRAIRVFVPLEGESKKNTLCPCVFVRSRIIAYTLFSVAVVFPLIFVSLLLALPSCFSICCLEESISFPPPAIRNLLTFVLLLNQPMKPYIVTCFFFSLFVFFDDTAHITALFILMARKGAKALYETEKEGEGERERLSVV